MLKGLIVIHSFSHNEAHYIHGMGWNLRPYFSEKSYILTTFQFTIIFVLSARHSVEIIFCGFERLPFNMRRLKPQNSLARTPLKTHWCPRVINIQTQHKPKSLYITSYHRKSVLSTVLQESNLLSFPEKKLVFINPTL